MEQDLFKDVYGYDFVKKELLAVKALYDNEELLKDKSVSLPKGILLQGSTGCGKTMLLKLFSESFNCPKFYIDEVNFNGVKVIKDAFNKARQHEFSIIVIDELSLLIDKEDKVVRQLQMELDGVNKNNRLLVIATTNDIDNIPSPLLRQGRFDRIFTLFRPDEDERFDLFKGYIDKFKMNIKDSDIEFLVRLTDNDNCAKIKSIVENAYIEKKEKATIDDLETSIEKLENGSYFEEHYKGDLSYQICVHEAGHIVMAKHYSQYKTFYKTYFDDSEEATTIFLDNGYNMTKTNVDRVNAKIHMKMAGYLAEKIVLHEPSIGSANDRIDIFRNVFVLIDYEMVKGVKYSRAENKTSMRGHCGPKINNRSDKAMAKYYKKQERIASRILKREKDTIIKIADQLYEEKELTYRTIKY